MPSLDSIIREVKSNEPCDRQCQVLVTLNASNGQLPGPYDFLRAKKHFLINNKYHPRGRVERIDLSWTVQDFENHRSVEIRIDYHAECLPGHEVRLASAVCMAQDRDTFLDQAVLRWAKAYVDGAQGEAGFLANFGDEEKYLCEYLRDSAVNELGLSLSARLKVVSGPDRFASWSEKIHVYPSDSQEAREISVQATFERMARPPSVYVHNTTKDEVLATAKSTLLDFFAEHVQLTYCFHPLPTNLVSHLQSLLQSKLYHLGWQIGSFRLEGAKRSANAKETVPVDQTITCKLIDREIKVRAQMILKLQNAVAFEKAKAPNVELWAEETLGLVLREVFLRKTMTDVVAQIKTLQGAADARMVAEADKIGYALEQALIVKDLHLVSDYDFKIEVQREGIPTRRPGVLVGLHIVVVGRIVNLTRAAKLIGQSQKIETAIETYVIDSLRHALCEIEPEDFYLYFDAPRDAMQRSVQSRLRDTITQTLEAHCGAEVRQVTCNPSETDVTRAVRGLGGPRRRVSIDVVTKNALQSVKVDAAFDVLGVRMDGWETFVRRTPRDTDIVDAFKNRLQMCLQECDFQWFMLTSYDELMGHINREISKPMGDAFGLSVKVVEFIRATALYQEGNIAIYSETEKARVETRKLMVQTQPGTVAKVLESRARQITRLEAHVEELDQQYRSEVNIDPKQAIETRKRKDAAEAELQNLYSQMHDLPTTIEKKLGASAYEAINVLPPAPTAPLLAHHAPTGPNPPTRPTPPDVIVGAVSEPHPPTLRQTNPAESRKATAATAAPTTVVSEPSAKRPWFVSNTKR